MDHDLKRAIERNDISHVRSLLENGAGSSGMANAAESAQMLIAAIWKDESSTDMVSLLLAAGFPAHTVDDQLYPGCDRTPFMAAAKAGRMDLMKLLFNAGADPHWKSPAGKNAASEVLKCCANESDSNRAQDVAAYLAHLNVVIDPLSEDSQDRLIYAAYGKETWGDLPKLLGLGIPQDRLRWTPLMFKIAAGTATVADVASQADGDLEKRDIWDRSAFLISIVGDRKDIAEALLVKGSDLNTTGRCGMNVLHYAARCDHEQILVWLLSLGMPVDSHDESENTPLMTAAGSNSLACARCLVATGADVRAEDTNGFQAIHEATGIDMIRLLIEAGADVNAISGGGDWSLKEAASDGDADLLRYLLGVGAVVDLNSTGETALFGAVRKDSEKCVALLLAAGANVNAQDCDGWTCLWNVESVGMARLLLDHGADPSIVDQCGGVPESWSLPPQVSALFREHRLRKVGE